MIFDICWPFIKATFWYSIRVTNSLDPGWIQIRPDILSGRDLIPSCLQLLGCRQSPLGSKALDKDFPRHGSFSRVNCGNWRAEVWNLTRIKDGTCPSGASHLFRDKPIRLPVSKCYFLLYLSTVFSDIIGEGGIFAKLKHFHAAVLNRASVANFKTSQILTPLTLS